MNDVFRIAELRPLKMAHCWIRTLLRDCILLPIHLYNCHFPSSTNPYRIMITWDNSESWVFSVSSLNSLSFQSAVQLNAQNPSWRGHYFCRWQDFGLCRKPEVCCRTPAPTPLCNTNCCLLLGGRGGGCPYFKCLWTHSPVFTEAAHLVFTAAAD